MKPVLAWMKANTAIVILTLVIILILPLAFIGSAYWNGKIKKSRQDAATSALNNLNGLRVSYSLPPATPGGAPVTVEADAPNEQLTRYFREKKTELEKQIGQVVNIAEEANKKEPLVEGVFPSPANQIKTLEMANVMIGAQGRPSAYEVLLKKIGAGGPADHTQLATSLSEIRQMAMEKVRSDTGREQLSAEEQDALVKELVGRRLGAYKQHANTISVYATPDVLPPDVPRVMPDQQPDVNTCFKWQWDYWAIEDMINAVAAANTRNGRRTNVPDSVVKRIERITLIPFSFTPPSDPSAFGGGGAMPSTPPSITGRQSGGGNGLYDLRAGELTLIVASARIPELMDAIARTNLMTVTGLAIEDIDEWADLEEGYYYGTEHVVRVRIPVEMVLLRSWTVALMPQQIRDVITNAAPAADPNMGMVGAVSAEVPSAPVVTPAPAKGGKAKKKSTKRPQPKDSGGDPF